MWALLALSAALLTSFNPILYKRILRDVDTLGAVWSITLLSLPLLASFTFLLGPRVPRIDWVFFLGVLGSAALNAIAQLASARALKLAEASLVTPLLIFSPVFTLLIGAIFLGENPSARGLLGIGLVLVGAYLLNYESGRGWMEPFKSLALTPGVVLVLFAGLLWAITPLFEKTAILHTQPEDSGFTALAATAFLVAILTPATLARRRSALSKLEGHRQDVILAALIAGTAPVLGYTALSIGLVGYVTTLFKISTLLTVIWSFLFLGERGWVRRLPASVLMVIGAVLLAG